MAATRTAVILAALVLVGGCAAPAPRDGLPKGWYRPQARAALAERHCYRTLAEVDCHARALPGEDYRRVGYFDAPAAR